MTAARTKDFVIYITMGLLASLMIYVPVYLGADTASIFPHLKLIGSGLIMISCVAVESQRWLSRPALWIYLAAVGALHIGCAYWIYDRGFAVSVVGWVLVGSIEIYVFSHLFRRFAEMEQPR